MLDVEVDQRCDPMIARISLCRLGQPEDIASAFVFLASAVRFSKGGTNLYEENASIAAAVVPVDWL